MSEEYLKLLIQSLSTVGGIVISLLGLYWRFKVRSDKKEKEKEEQNNKKAETQKNRYDIIEKNLSTIRETLKDHGEKIQFTYDYAEHSHQVKILDEILNYYASDLIDEITFKNDNIEEFVITGTESAIMIFKSILKVGFKRFTPEFVERKFKKTQKYLKREFNNLDLGINKTELNKIINNEKELWLFDIKRIIKDHKNGERLELYTNRCKKFIFNIIKAINIM